MNLDGHVLQFKAIPLPTGFVPAAIMKDGAIPGKIGNHAAVFEHGRLSVLKDFPGCVSGEQAQGFSITATSENVQGDVVGFCSYFQSAQPFAVGIPLLYENGSVRPLNYPMGALGASILAMSINDFGVIVGTVNSFDQESSELYRLFPNGKQATVLASTGFFIDPINDNGEIANTVFTPDGGQAWITRITGQSDLIIPTPGAGSLWINDRNDVVGFSQTDSFGGRGAFVYHNRVVTLLPSPALVATGINNRGDIIGTATGGIFLHSDGITRLISSEITPHANYSLVNPSGFSWLVGLGDRLEFVATTGAGQFYLIKQDHTPLDR